MARIGPIIPRRELRLRRDMDWTLYQDVQENGAPVPLPGADIVCIIWPAETPNNEIRVPGSVADSAAGTIAVPFPAAMIATWRFSRGTFEVRAVKSDGAKICSLAGPIFIEGGR